MRAIVWCVLLVLAAMQMSVAKQNCKESYQTNQEKSYIELVMVVEANLYLSLRGDVFGFCTNIVNTVNTHFERFSIAVALVDVVVWTNGNQIKLTDNNTANLVNFAVYRQDFLEVLHPSDFAILLTATYTEEVLGQTVQHSMCSYAYAVSTVYGGGNISEIAVIVAHEIGHSFGVQHDSPECDCVGNFCIMTDGLTAEFPTSWSWCSSDQINLAFSRGMNHCLRNKPEALFGLGFLDLCGNGFVDPGEQCDCGPIVACKNKCCNPHSCLLNSNASCANGECCDLSTCRVHNAGTICRHAEGECDIAEQCTGDSENCPENLHKKNGKVCDNGSGRCYEGTCPSHTEQCKLLWGVSGHSFDGCYVKNSEGTLGGDCGYNPISKTFRKCSEEGVKCGRLQCIHWSQSLLYGWDRSSTFSQHFVPYGHSIVTCQTVIIDMGLRSIDPGMVPVCDDGKFCLGQKCLPMENLQNDHDCNHHGIVDNKGGCHCDDGFVPPFCDTFPQPTDVPVSGSIFFFAIVPITLALALILFCIMSKRRLHRHSTSTVMETQV